MTTIDKNFAENILAVSENLLAAIPEINADENAILMFSARIDALVRQADAASIVNRQFMIESGVWVDAPDLRTKLTAAGPVLTVRSEAHEHIGAGGTQDDFRTTFARAVRHVRRYTRGVLSGISRSYGYTPGDEWQQAALPQPEIQPAL
jgi:hypothetical protein